VLRGCIILGLFWWIASLAAKLLQRWTLRLPDVSPSGRVLLDKVFQVTLAVVGILVALHAMGIDITALAVFGGAIGLGIGFGLQQIVANLISGFILLLDRSVKPGDVVAIDAKYGWINAIGAPYVSVITRDGIEHLIPNEQLITNKVENWSHSNNLLRLHLPIGIAYEADVHRAIDLAEQAARDVVRILGEPPPHCLLMGFGDSAVDLELRIWINDPKSGIHNVRSAVLLRVWDVFREHGITFPFPQRDLHLKTAVPVTVVSPAGPLATASAVAAAGPTGVAERRPRDGRVPHR
jgi:small-conductance mechanosensitive channel